MMDAAAIKRGARLAMKQLGERITYRPKGAADRDMLAVVQRGTPEGIPESPAGGQHKNLTVYVVNDSSSIEIDDVGGISSDELNTGGDKMDLPVRIDKRSKTRSIARIISQDEGMLTLEVR